MFMDFGQCHVRKLARTQTWQALHFFGYDYSIVGQKRQKIGKITYHKMQPLQDLRHDEYEYTDNNDNLI